MRPGLTVTVEFVIIAVDNKAEAETNETEQAPIVSRPVTPHETAFGCPRDFLDNRFVYLVVSPRARGLSIGINMNPDKRCNFDCVYCEVNRTLPPRENHLDVEVMAAELKRTIEFVRNGRLRELPAYHNLPDELLKLRHVALSGDGEPTYAPNFAEAVQAVIHVRALIHSGFCKLVLLTNATGLDQPPVLNAIKHFTKADEIWAKLDGGTEAYLNRVNQSTVPLAHILANILLVGRQHPIVIQSLFPAINGEEPPLAEIDEFARRLIELKRAGAQISLVQIYSATRPTVRSEYGHLPLKSLSRIAQTVRQFTGLKAEVF